MFLSQGNVEDGCEICPHGTYRGSADLFATRSCIACPADSGTINAVSQASSKISHHRAQKISVTNPANECALPFPLRTTTLTRLENIVATNTTKDNTSWTLAPLMQQHDNPLRRDQGAESVSQCKCNRGFYDTLEGAGGNDGTPSCSECLFGGVGWDTVGAISVAACSCPVGWYLDEVAEACVQCTAGTYKVRALLSGKQQVVSLAYHRGNLAEQGSSRSDHLRGETRTRKRPLHRFVVTRRIDCLFGSPILRPREYT